MATMRTQRVGEEIRRVVSERLVRGLRDPVPGFVTISEVEVNRDFTRAVVFFSVYGDDASKDAAGKALNAQRAEFRREVGRQIRLRNTPEIVFVSDDTAQRAARIHQLLNENPPLLPEDGE